MTAFEFDRRAVLAMGAAVTVSGAHRAMAADGDFPARLAEMLRDGRVSGLHTLLVSQGGKVLLSTTAPATTKPGQAARPSPSGRPCCTICVR
jgi:hypothetical protein